MDSHEDPKDSRRALRLSRIDHGTRWVDLDDPDDAVEDIASELVVDAGRWELLEQLYRESVEE